ncbi:hypothetical protein TraAM80_10391 [Trypanosoma rangeli]|uniref:Uncharacterized protein n=1 Tax=Trypanosoma rangeli TaxID=5698 RepID=A0A3R7LDK2_TRYRA|nr:uncharacterized protein TraAM80_10391 [Trypanosoma rangeli]RNE95121.1 hypothetical protein TraAM80_10391 [Trypanosoma rangeli]|eukprot:RNE95121.1 hypothetical protein TraAM80_10391 [Trypanosoma rangeli]
MHVPHWIGYSRPTTMPSKTKQWWPQKGRRGTHPTRHSMRDAAPTLTLRYGCRVNARRSCLQDARRGGSRHKMTLWFAAAPSTTRRGTPFHERLLLRRECQIWLGGLEVPRFALVSCWLRSVVNC